MPVHTMRLAILCSYKTSATYEIFSNRDGFEMGRIDAIATTTQMVKADASIADHVPKNPPMHKCRAPMNCRLRIARHRETTSP